MAFTIVTQGSILSTGLNVNVPVPSSIDYFKTINYTQMNLAGSVCVGGEWFNGVTNQNDGIRWTKAGSNVLNMSLFSTSSASNGFNYYKDYPIVEPQNANAITAISQAANAVVTQTNTYQNGDILRLYGTTGMLQIGGADFEISSASGSGYTLIGLNSSGFASAGTAGFTRRISTYAAVDPQFLYITGISQALQAVVTCSVDPTPYYVVGMKIHFSVPASFGMTQISQMTGTITAVSAAAYTVTVNIDSTAFTAFAFPASTASPTATLFATFAPAGQSTQFNPITRVQTGYDFNKAPFHTGQFVPFMQICGGAQSPGGAAGDTIIWQAYKMEVGVDNFSV